MNIFSHIFSFFDRQEDELEDDDDAEESESEEEDEDDNDKPRRRKSRAFVKPPPREPLPQRTTRGLRVGALAAATDDQADEEFWNQEFFAEEERDVQYETESEPEDLVDADFMQSVRSIVVFRLFPFFLKTVFKPVLISLLILCDCAGG